MQTGKWRDFSCAPDDCLKGDRHGHGAHVFRYPTVVNRKDTDKKISWERNTSRIPPILNTPVLIGGGPSVSPNRKGVQDIGSLSGTIRSEEFRNAQPLHTSINGNSAKHRDPAPTFSKIIGRELSDESSDDIYSRY